MNQLLYQTSNNNVVIYLFELSLNQPRLVSISAGDFQHAFGQIYEFVDMGISCTVHRML